MTMAETYLYRHFGADGELLYVGISLSVFNRTKQHSLGSRWFEEIRNISVEKFVSRAVALEAEKKAIIAERPKYNVVHSRAELPATNKYREASKAEFLNNVVEFKLLYSISDAARALGLPQSVVRSFMSNGHLSFVMVGDRRKITGWQLIEFLEALESGEL